MSTRLLAEYAAMTRVAADQRHARNTLIKIQHERREAGLGPVALGRIAPAHQDVVTFRDVNWQPPAIDLARIRLQPERCFEEPSNGPRWRRSARLGVCAKDVGDVHERVA